MGDIRNKLEKELRQKRHEAMMRRLYPPKPPRPENRCKCGHSERVVPDNVPIMWWVCTNTFFHEYTLYCPACLPFEFFPDVMMDAANLPDDLG